MDCYIVMVKILSHIMKVYGTFELQDALNLYNQCLVILSQKLASLSKLDQEFYYTEVKQFIKYWEESHR